MAPRWRNVTLSNPSPDRTHFVKLESEGLPSIQSFAKPYYNLGGLQIDPAANRARALTTRSATGLELIDTKGRTTAVQIPQGALVSDPQWSPDGSRIAFLVHFPNETHVFVADVATGRSRQITRTPVLATLNTAVDWTQDGTSLVTVLVPSRRGAAPGDPAVPTGPEVRITEPGKNVQRTYPSLLETAADKARLEYYTTGQLALVNVGNRRVRNIGSPAMIRSVDVGMNGRYFRVTTMMKPFSYVVPVSSFGSKEQIWDANGRVLATLTETPLNTGVEPDSATRAARETEPRNAMWRPDGAGLSFLQQAPAPQRPDTAAATRNGGRQQAGNRARRKDRLMLWKPPFDSASQSVVYEADARMSDVTYTKDPDLIFVTEGNTGQRSRFGFGGGRNGGGKVYGVYLSDPSKTDTVATYKADDFYGNPGTLVTTAPSRRGFFRRGGGASQPTLAQLSSDGGSVFLQGTIYSRQPLEEGPRPFIDRVEIKTGDKTRVFEGEKGDVSESVVAILNDDATQLVVSRESATTVPDSYLRDASGTLTKLTDNKDYNPDITHAPVRIMDIARPDGFKLRVKVTLPPDYKAGTRLPGLIWFYPREYTDQESYDETLRTYDKNTFPNLGVRSMVYFIKLGYAVIEPDAPIIGQSGQMNNNYVNDLRNDLYTVIGELDRDGIIDPQRMAVGGHSYGAFSTANAMVHTPFFKAGIAGDGNYNRTLTPFSFQTERRDIWEARDIYFSMSPLFYANNLSGALLMYHGMADQNVGTFPINSDRMFAALNFLGKTAALYKYPFEDHGPGPAGWRGWTSTSCTPSCSPPTEARRQKRHSPASGRHSAARRRRASSGSAACCPATGPRRYSRHAEDLYPQHRDHARGHRRQRTREQPGIPALDAGRGHGAFRGPGVAHGALPGGRHELVRALPLHRVREPRLPGRHPHRPHLGQGHGVPHLAPPLPVPAGTGRQDHRPRRDAMGLRGHAHGPPAPDTPGPPGRLPRHPHGRRGPGRARARCPRLRQTAAGGTRRPGVAPTFPVWRRWPPSPCAPP
ncbi:MAG: prolyl oligopeptidase family serine peptidase, partial [Gemmatimonadota bacterium]